MKEKGFLHRGHEGVTDAAQHGVVWPYGERILTFLFQLLGIVDHHLLAVFRCDVEVWPKRRVEDPLVIAKFLCMNIRVRSRMISILVYKKERMKDLMHCMSIHGGSDLGKCAEVA